MPSFPTAVKSFATVVNGGTIQAATTNDIQDEISAIETGYLNGTARLNAAASTLTSLSVTGASTLAGTVLHGSAWINGPEPGAGSYTLSTGNTNDLAVSSAVSLIRLVPNSSGSTLTGLAFSGGAANRQMLLLMNVSGTVDLVLGNATGSASSGQFLCPGAAAFTVRKQGGVWVSYDANNPAWRVCAP